MMRSIMGNNVYRCTRSVSSLFLILVILFVSIQKNDISVVSFPMTTTTTKFHHKQQHNILTTQRNNDRSTLLVLHNHFFPITTLPPTKVVSFRGGKTNQYPTIRSKQSTSTRSTSLSMGFGNNNNNKNSRNSEKNIPVVVNLDPNDQLRLRDTSKALRRASFVSWWSQVILTTVSSVILLFAKSASGGGGVIIGNSRQMKFTSIRFVLSGLGIFFSACSILWTWGNGSRLSKRLVETNKPMTIQKAISMVKRAVEVSIFINLFGLLFNLLAAEEIIGALAVKVLTSSTTPTMVSMLAAASNENILQPLDILVVQANTNALLSHYISLCCNFYLAKVPLTNLSSSVAVAGASGMVEGELKPFNPKEEQ